jgi:hypothetical protein
MTRMLRKLEICVVGGWLVGLACFLTAVVRRNG